MRIFGVSGYSGTGKTTLVEAIIKSLVSRGYNVATIKSSKQEEGPDQGTDTWRHKEAGASMVIFLGPYPKPIGLKERIGEDVLVRLNKHDFLIIEGMKSANIPKFWCVGDTEFKREEVPVNTQAIVSWIDREIDIVDEINIINADAINELIEIVKTKSVDYSEIE